MRADFPEHLVCPLDGEPLELHEAVRDGEEITGGHLDCPSGHRFAVRDALPRLVPEEEGATAAEAGQQTRDSFSGKWNRIPEFGHDDASREIYVNWYLERFGFGDLDGLRSFLADKPRILDAGTGVGRDAWLYSTCAPDSEVFAVDLSTAIDAAYRNTRAAKNLHLAQADLTRLPFPKNYFDYVASDQVIHHTPDTEASFKGLVEHVAPGGQFATYVYKKKSPIREFSDDFLRAHYTRASEEECYEFSRAITLLGKALTELDVELDVPEDIPILGIQAGRQNLQRFLYWNVFKCYWNDRLDLETNVMTNFDWYHPRYAHRHTPEEVRGWCEDCGLEIVHFNVVESGISVRARKPAAA